MSKGNVKAGPPSTSMPVFIKEGQELLTRSLRTCEDVQMVTDVEYVDYLRACHMKLLKMING